MQTSEMLSLSSAVVVNMFILLSSDCNSEAAQEQVQQYCVIQLRLRCMSALLKTQRTKLFC